MTANPTNDTDRAARIGRRVGTLLFALAISTFTAVCTVQILIQVFATEPIPPGLECRPAVKALLTAVRRARGAAAAQVGNERVALSRFRGALGPEWDVRRALDTVCRDDPAALGALKKLDQLRYAEEHAVRYEAVGLAGLRRRVETLDNDLSEPKK